METSSPGHLLTIGFDGAKYTPELGKRVRELEPGGFILFARNIINAAQTARLTADLIKLAQDVTGVTPFICVDQEGGRVSRMPKDYEQFVWPQGAPPRKHWPATNYMFPTARDLAADGSEELIEEVHQHMGHALIRLGFNVDFAPVLDLDTNTANPIIGDRSFSAEPQIASRLARAALRGLRSAGLLTCGKHFPGHGDTALDSHLDLPVDGRAKGRFRDVELAPFRMAVEERANFIMTAHVMYPAFDATLPATLSKAIVTGLLREELGYDGVIVSDDLDMKALSDRWPDEEAARLALLAGCDHLLACHDPRRQYAAAAAITRLLDDGAITDAELHARLDRIKSAKARMTKAEAL
ncbi:MAG: beta-N-acetylhexosaminidase [Nitrospinae bacterium]|nr:beta-N-acetylhexosaminidase [Nitrospinota bacterium]